MTNLVISFGHFALYLALLFCVYGVGAAMFGALRGRPEWTRSAERAVYAVFALLTLSMLGLEAALLSDRFDIAFVSQNSSREQPWFFKLPALWGG